MNVRYHVTFETSEHVQLVGVAIGLERLLLVGRGL
jgi:hypothetical protein